MIFYKSSASGNDFLHVDIRDYLGFVSSTGKNDIRPAKSSLAQRLCARHTGPGADGVIYYRVRENIDKKTESVDFEIFNSDGTLAELSGNGMAGLTALMFYLDRFTRQVTLNTSAGQKTHRQLNRDGSRFRLNIEIGSPDFNASSFFPFLKPNHTRSYLCDGIDFYPVSVGNPHAVVLLNHDPGNSELERMGAILDDSPMFPLNTNVEFVITQPEQSPDYENGKHFRVFFYERGVGPTLASSTGSAAVFAVLQRLGFIDQHLSLPPAQVYLPETSPFPVKISGKNAIAIENSVEIVYKGIYLN